MKQNRDRINSTRKERRHLVALLGENVPKKRGGIKPNPLRFKPKRKYINRKEAYGDNWDLARKIIYKRDNWTCQECGIKCHNQTKKDIIQCHHIDYNTKNHEPNNLITLCVSCHMKTNFKRMDWTKHFQSA